MKHAWIVLNLSTAEKYTFVPFREKYRVFADTDEGKQALLDHARSIGYNDMFSFGGISDQVGMATTQQCGDANVFIMKVEVTGETVQRRLVERFTCRGCSATTDKLWDPPFCCELCREDVEGKKETP